MGLGSQSLRSLGRDDDGGGLAPPKSLKVWKILSRFSLNLLFLLMP